MSWRVLNGGACAQGAGGAGGVRRLAYNGSGDAMGAGFWHCGVKAMAAAGDVRWVLGCAWGRL